MPLVIAALVAIGVAGGGVAVAADKTSDLLKIAIVGAVVFLIARKVLK